MLTGGWQIYDYPNITPRKPHSDITPRKPEGDIPEEQGEQGKYHPPKTGGYNKYHQQKEKVTQFPPREITRSVEKNYDPPIAEDLRKSFPELQPLIQRFLSSLTRNTASEVDQTRKLSLLSQLSDASAGSTADEFRKALTAAIDAGAASVNYVKKVLQSLRQRRSEADEAPPVARA
jgi:hypothetical protein